MLNGLLNHPCSQLLLDAIRRRRKASVATSASSAATSTSCSTTNSSAPPGTSIGGGHSAGAALRRLFIVEGGGAKMKKKKASTGSSSGSSSSSSVSSASSTACACSSCCSQHDEEHLAGKKLTKEDGGDQQQQITSSSITVASKPLPTPVIRDTKGPARRGEEDGEEAEDGLGPLAMMAPRRSTTTATGSGQQRSTGSGRRRCSTSAAAAAKLPRNARIQRLVERFRRDPADSLPAGHPQAASDRCCICADRRASVRAYPCGHQSLCRLCAVLVIKTLAETDHDRMHCVVCRQEVQVLRHQKRPYAATTSPPPPTDG